MKRINKIVSFIILVAVFALPFLSAESSSEKKLIIGGKNFTEQYILPEMAKILLEKNGFNVELKTGVGSTVVRQSLESGQIDLYYEYTGTSYTVYNKQDDKDIMTDQEKCYEWVKKRDGEKGLVWLDIVQFNNTYTLMMRKEQAKNLGIATISDLGKFINEHNGDLIIGVGPEFYERPDGLKTLMELYDFSVPQDKIKKMDDSLVYQALKDEKVDVSMGFATDGRIAAFGFINLVDDRSFFPIYNPAPVVRREVLKKYPEIRNILKPMSERLTTTEMQRLNAMADIEHKEISEVALGWLKENGLL
ncbi:MAG: glycine/betaine ABC transporter substrate-binding protein [Deltaproteobacteria bacterium]|nr:glycine/betaine ABC transporter substrate-binding protein [Deltaproteobacteria bacterium]